MYTSEEKPPQDQEKVLDLAPARICTLHLRFILTHVLKSRIFHEPASFRYTCVNTKLKLLPELLNEEALHIAYTQCTCLHKAIQVRICLCWQKITQKKKILKKKQYYNNIMWVFCIAMAYIHTYLHAYMNEEFYSVQMIIHAHIYCFKLPETHIRHFMDKILMIWSKIKIFLWKNFSLIWVFWGFYFYHWTCKWWRENLNYYKKHDLLSHRW